MKKFAVIDVGSNSVRLMLVADGKVLYKAVSTTRLGEGLADSGRLNQEAIARSVEAVAHFFARAKEEGAEGIFAFATAAVRSAENGRDFIDAAYRRCGLQIEVIAGEEEAEIGILGALGNADGGVIDVGGASTEIVLRQGGRTVYKKSVDVGVVRLKDRCGRDGNALMQMSKESVRRFGVVPHSGTLTAIGGTATTLGAISAGLTEYSASAVTGVVITQEDMAVLSDRLLSMSVEEIAALPCVPKGRADVLTGGAVLLHVLMDELGISSLIVSDKDNLEGYAVKRGLAKSL